MIPVSAGMCPSANHEQYLLNAAANILYHCLTTFSQIKLPDTNKLLLNSVQIFYSNMTKTEKTMFKVYCCKN